MSKIGTTNKDDQDIMEKCRIELKIKKVSTFVPFKSLWE